MKLGGILVQSSVMGDTVHMNIGKYDNEFDEGYFYTYIHKQKNYLFAQGLESM